MYRPDTTETAHTCHLGETPQASPCRNCEYWDKDKNEFPACINCLKLSPFATRPMNLDITPDPDLQPPAANRPPRYQKFTPKNNAVPATAKCSVPGCEKPARYNHFKDIWNDYLCHNCYLRMFRRHKKTGSIYNKDFEI